MRHHATSWNNRTVLCIQPPDQISDRLIPPQFGEARVPDLNRHGRIPNVRTDAHITARAQVHTTIQADPRHPLLVARKDYVVVNQVERHASNASVRRDEQRRRPNRAIELDPEAGSDPTVPSTRSSEPDPTVSNAR